MTIAINLIHDLKPLSKASDRIKSHFFNKECSLYFALIFIWLSAIENAHFNWKCVREKLEFIEEMIDW